MSVTFFFCIAHFVLFVLIRVYLLQLGKYMSGAMHIAFQNLKKSKAEVVDEDAQIADLELQLQNLKLSSDVVVSGLRVQLKDEKDWAEKESGELRSELASVREKLAQESEEAIMARFKELKSMIRLLPTSGLPKSFIIRS